MNRVVLCHKFMGPPYAVIEQVKEFSRGKEGQIISINSNESNEGYISAHEFHSYNLSVLIWYWEEETQ